VNDHDALPNDPVERFLDGRHPFPSDSPLRETLLRETTRRLRRRRQLKRLGLVAAVAACYLAGLSTPRPWRVPPQAPDSLEIAQQDSKPDGQASPTPASPPRVDEPDAIVEGPPLEQDPDAPALVFERVAAAASAEQRPILLRRAGDRYLENDHDVTSLREANLPPVRSLRRPRGPRPRRAPRRT
jgi:hypothetical protein